MQITFTNAKNKEAGREKFFLSVSFMNCAKTIKLLSPLQEPLCTAGILFNR